MPISWFDEPKNSPAALGSKLSTDATLINTLTSSVFGVYLQAASSLVTGLIISSIANWRVGLVAWACCPIQVAAVKIRSKFHRDMSASGEDAYQESVAFASEAVNNMRTVAALGKEDLLLKNYSDKLEVPLQKSIKHSHTSGLAHGFSQSSNFLVNALVFYVSALFMRSYGLGFNDMFMAINAIRMSSMAMAIALQSAPDVGAAQNAAHNIFKILDTVSAINIDDPRQNVRKPINPLL